MTIFNSFFQRSRWLRFTTYFVVAMAVFGVLGAWLAPAILRPWLEKSASEALQRQVHIAGLEINPYLLQVTLRDVVVKDQYGDFVSFKSLLLDAEMSSIFRLAPVLRAITLEQAKIQIVRLSADQYNFSDLLKAKPSKTNAATELPRFSLNNIRLMNGSVRLDDRFVGKIQTLDQLNFALPFLSTLPQRMDDYIQPHFSGRFNGSPFALQGESKPFKDSLDTALKIQIKQQDLMPLLGYAPLPPGVQVSQAQLSTNVDLVFRQKKDRAELILNGHLVLADAAVTLQAQPLVALKQLDIELKNMQPLAQQYRFGVIALQGLDLAVSRDSEALLNWQKLQAKTAPKTASSASAVAKVSSPVLLEVAELKVTNSRVHWLDQSVKPAHSSTLQAIDLNLKHISNQANKSFPLRLSATTARDARLAAELNITAQPLNLAGHITASNIQAADFSPYYTAFLAAQLKSTLNLTTDLQFNAEPLQYALKNTQLELENTSLALAKDKKPALLIAQMSVNDIALDSTTQQIQIGQLHSQNGELQLKVEKNGRINLLQALPASSAPSKPTINAKPWQVQLKEGNLQGWRVELSDNHLENAKPLLWKNIVLQLKNVDSKPGAKAHMNLSAQGGRGAKISVAGPWVPQPFSGQFRVDLANLDAAYGQPYFSKYINISLASGFLHAKGDLNIATQPKFTGSYKGNLRSTNLYALDKTTGADFLKWKSLYIGGINAQFVPLNIAIGEVALSDFYSRLILSADGRLNLQDVMVKNGEQVSVTTERAAVDKASAPTSAPVTLAEGEGVAVPIKIDKITLNNGQIQYSDLFIKPNFSANLTEMGGVIGGISSQNDTRASLDLRGSVDKIAPVEIKGSLNPLAKDFFIDIKGGVKGYELTNASAYAIKYAGYGIQKGKMSMDVAYLIENKKLKASNKLFLDQLTLGDAVESPTATKLPVKFALSLLTDRKGQIKLNLPIEGSLDDPQFSVGGIIWQVIGNVLEKIVTAPFDALASAFGDGPSLSYINFASGQARLDDQAKLALSNLAQALTDRPDLQLEITGWASSDADAEGLRTQLLNNKMQALKAAELGEKAESVNSEDEANFSAAERPALLTQVYKSEKFPKPKNLLGLNKSIPVEDMEKLLLANTVIGNEQLKMLAMARAQRVKNALKEAGVDDARMFITQAKIDATAEDTKADQGSVSRVQFKLK
ncbi:DUF748 domain-containing protein [Deefgea rivuli]|uniref:DUF748 domain-containing protein n=1 Tax=Deefgea rivuli TaxID=400948 RepID=UPI0004810F4C|nr:DUF748 domain-containing protein [Deefgea rivuli]